jgi:hypothetical protein
MWRRKKRTILTVRRAGVAATTVAWVALAARPAIAGEDLAALATDPITLSEIEHDDLHVSLDSWGASLSAREGTGARDVFAFADHLRVESPLATRNYYFHLEYQTGTATSPSYGGSKILGGNVIAGGRVVWLHAQGMALGGDLGLALPTARYGSDQAKDVSLVLASMRPWDYDAFRASSLTVLPAIDVRAVFGPVTMQLRHQVDWAIDSGHSPRSNLSTITTLYVGVRVKQLFSPGVELAELYLLDPSIQDDRRAEAIIAPGLRLNLGRASPEVGVMTNVGQLIHPALDRVVAFRVSCTFSLEPTVLAP